MTHLLAEPNHFQPLCQTNLSQIGLFTKCRDPHIQISAGQQKRELNRANLLNYFFLKKATYWVLSFFLRITKFYNLSLEYSFSLQSACCKKSYFESMCGKVLKHNSDGKNLFFPTSTTGSWEFIPFIVFSCWTFPVYFCYFSSFLSLSENMFLSSQSPYCTAYK